MEIRAGKTFRTKEERLAIIEETLDPKASVAQVALNHGINANQIFHWRRQHREGHFATDEKQQSLVAVRVVDQKPARHRRLEVPSLKKLRQKEQPPTAATIEIDLGHARVRIEGTPDPECVRVIMEKMGARSLSQRNSRTRSANTRQRNMSLRRDCRRSPRIFAATTRRWSTTS
jgi:transposase